MTKHDGGWEPTATFEPNHADISYERLDGETIVISLTDGMYYSFSGTAADIWWLIQEGFTISEMLTSLSTVFNLPSKDIGELGIDTFFEKAVERKLIKESSKRPTSLLNLPNDYLRGVWTPPRFTEFTDLKDLILVDPIHDTTALGWPMIRDE